MPGPHRCAPSRRLALAGLLLGAAAALPWGAGSLRLGATAQAGELVWPARVSGTQGAGLLVRAGPGAEFAVLALLPEASAVLVLRGPQADRQGRGWYLLTGTEPGGPLGWSAAEYLTPRDPGDVGAGESSAAPAWGGRSFVARLTAYSYQTPGGGAHGWRTRTDTPARWGVVAVDPAVVPLGARVRIEGFDTVFVAEDTGGGVRGQHLDIFFPEESAAARFGVQYRLVSVLP